MISAAGYRTVLIFINQTSAANPVITQLSAYSNPAKHQLLTVIPAQTGSANPIG